MWGWLINNLRGVVLVDPEEGVKWLKKNRFKYRKFNVPLTMLREVNGVKSLRGVFELDDV